jgi:hypothetical protein
MVIALSHDSKGLGDNLWTVLSGRGLAGLYDFSLA